MHVDDLFFISKLLYSKGVGCLYQERCKHQTIYRYRLSEALLIRASAETPRTKLQICKALTTRDSGLARRTSHRRASPEPMTARAQCIRRADANEADEKEELLQDGGDVVIHRTSFSMAEA